MMANISIYDPLTSRLSRLFNHLTFSDPRYFDEFDSNERMNLKMDIDEDEHNYTVHVDLPGVKKEDVRISVNGNQVSIEAEIKRIKENKKDKNFICCERYEGRVYRSFTLNCDVDESKTEARLSDGVLELTLPKKSETSHKQIRVQ